MNVLSSFVCAKCMIPHEDRFCFGRHVSPQPHLTHHPPHHTHRNLIIPARSLIIPLAAMPFPSPFPPLQPTQIPQSQARPTSSR